MAVDYHMGQRLNQAIEEIGAKKEYVSESIGYSRKHIYKLFERETLSWRVIKKVGTVLRVDMHPWFPEMPPEVQDVQPKSENWEPENLPDALSVISELRKKYTDILEKYSTLLEDLTK